jgi:hypothetical protein
MSHKLIIPGQEPVGNKPLTTGQMGFVDGAMTCPTPSAQGVTNFVYKPSRGKRFLVMFIDLIDPNVPIPGYHPGAVLAERTGAIPPTTYSPISETLPICESCGCKKEQHGPTEECPPPARLAHHDRAMALMNTAMQMLLVHAPPPEQSSSDPEEDGHSNTADPAAE